MKGQTIVLEKGAVAKGEDAYNLFICDYCKRQCKIIARTTEKPLGFIFLDEFIPMPWKDPTE